MSEKFYEEKELDLRYPELAYNTVPITRASPGKIPFYIPVLYPNQGKIDTPSKVIQKPSNIKNTDKNTQISNIEVGSNILINVPRELCGFVGDFHDYKNEIKEIKLDGTVNYYGTNNYSTELSGGLSHSHAFTTGGVTQKKSLDMNGTSNGRLEMFPVSAVIPAMSEWVVVFIGGDVTKPVIIART